jgi:hypothetical protein
MKQYNINFKKFKNQYSRDSSNIYVRYLFSCNVYESQCILWTDIKIGRIKYGSMIWGYEQLSIYGKISI